ncbi:STAS/SEC14 domain-containing protein [Methylomicrobium sp. Wu6]|uniref:STAS/SEC14 domain-containing protein n=1 Tax=Methylomicrobium sp. Wu6 TaxID=3107928 RepID=UPI002DD6480E|nr:STAS/SEC14 domain-containing protein [Methylomicrobium sp. Wu6]MEC4748110.1 STAS/SEC14 domain-containing protein [Methylomicrobium sp. Wu6]
MTIRLIKTLDSENWIKVSDKLTVSEFQKLQSMGELSLEWFGQFRVLIELEDFQGWSREPGWVDSFFVTEDGKRISKVAFVGDEKWKDEVFMFMGKQMRKTAIEFFPKVQLAEAKAWLCEDISQSIFID